MTERSFMRMETQPVEDAPANRPCVVTWKVEVVRYKFRGWIFAYVEQAGLGQPYPQEWIEVVW